MRTSRNATGSMWAAVLAVAALLGGCATVTTVETEVQSFAAAPATVKAGPFRFERLPSQEQDVGRAAQLEGLAQAALEKRGFARADADARYSVQLAAQTSDALLVYPGPFFGRPFWHPYARPSLLRGRNLYPSPWPEREVYVTRVHLEIRDLATGKLAYESTATNEESWFDTDTVLPALFEAVLTDFPSPPKGVRKVIVKLPGTS